LVETFPKSAIFLKIFLVIIVVMVLCPMAMGQSNEQPIGKMFINKTSLLPNETLNVTIVVKGYNLPKIDPPKWPSIPEFTLVDQTISEIPTKIGGKTYTRYRFVASYLPQESGIFTLPSIMVRIPGFKFETQPVQIKILNPNGTENTTEYKKPTQLTRPAPSQPPKIEATEEIRVIADLSNLTPYVGEQIVLTYKILTNVSIGQKVVQVQRPEYKQFWAEQVPFETNMPFETFVRRGVRYYQIFLEKLVLFPIESGEISVEPSSWKIIAKFERPEYHEEEKIITTTPIRFKVRPLPPLADGSEKRIHVGRYHLKIHYSSEDVKLGQAFPLYLTIKGSGNIRSLLPPQIPDDPNFKSVSIRPVHEKFSPFLDRSQSPPKVSFGGEKIWEILVYPQVLGQLSFPSIQYMYFDPVLADYRTTRTKQAIFHVEKVDDEIVSLSDPQFPVKDEEPFFLSKHLMASMLVVLFTILLVYLVLRRKGKIGAAGPKRVAGIEELLTEAKNMVEHKGAAAFYDLLFSALIQILQKVTGVAVQAMTREELTDVIQRKDLAEEDIQNIISVLEFCNEARFAGMEADRTTRVEMLKKVNHLHSAVKQSRFSSRSR